MSVRALYYIKNFITDNIPQSIFYEKLSRTLDDYSSNEIESLLYRVNYYNKLNNEFSLNSATINNIDKNKSLYYYDLKQYARYFQPDIRISYVFGDVITIPDEPSIVKSRPIDGNNPNSVIMNLNKVRHFKEAKDTLSFRAKKNMAVWRGRSNNIKRVNLAKLYHDSPLCDIGLVNGELPELMKPWLSMEQQLGYKYIVSVEGNDVATNLKWIMSSNSLCMMPKCVYETWFMEGLLVPGFHFVLLNDDISDLEEKISYYNDNPAEAEEIIKSAQMYTSMFYNKREEKLISILILLKYFSLSGQITLNGQLESLSESVIKGLMSGKTDADRPEQQLLFGAGNVRAESPILAA
ncbi:glycosyl transferase family 90 [Phyllobacterium leguminum]|uniref:Glycosyl transferase family 90 n=1 Tax=Phyllobacterium leguminum TaxID=314237 RepID=A0A318SX21_9HYPH|nr:glycosyl transferase family 90 [Phyllobacterium leguminum]PYE86531.1 glycosyl transferase family 90 [Phyllobacterium leguminum]